MISATNLTRSQLFSRSQITITRTTRLFWSGAAWRLSMNSRSPFEADEARLLAADPGLVPGASTLVITLPSSTR